MPPREDGASPKSFTWITGNPRSKKNITQIRRHAGQNSGVKAEDGARAHLSSSPRPDQGSSGKSFQAVYPSPRADEADEHSSSASVEQPISFRGHHPSVVAELGAASSTVTHEQLHAFQAVYPVTPSSEVPPSIEEGTTRPRKVAIWDLVNHSVEEEEQHRLGVLATTPRQDTEDDRQEYFSGSTIRTELRQALSEARSHSPKQYKSSPPPTTFALQANISKRRKATSSAITHSRASWRLGMTPSPRSMSLSKEDSQIEQILHQTSVYWLGRFESSWSLHLREHGSAFFDKVSDMESFGGSITTAGGLMALGRVDSASSILGRALPKLSELLIAQHPQICWFFDLSLSASADNALGRLRSQVKRVAASTSLTTLGRSHPITKILCLEFPEMSEGQRLRLRELIQRKLHELHTSFFGPHSYQTSGQCYYFAKVLAQIGRFEASHEVLSHLVSTWDDIYGANHIMSISAILELARVQLSLNDYSPNTDSLLSEAFRRTLVLEKASPDPFAAASPERQTPRGAGPKLARMDCLRTLGKLHVMRGNLETATMQYTAAVSIGVEELGIHVPAVQLALSDLDAVTNLVAARAQGDDAVRSEWLKRTPVEVGIRWVSKSDDGRSEEERERDREMVVGKLGLTSLGPDH